MSPYQHGEVFAPMTAQTDLDLGHYERFTRDVRHQGHKSTSPGASIRTSSPRNAAGVSRDDPVVPHVTNAIMEFVLSGNDDYDCAGQIAALSATSRACRSSRRPSAQERIAAMSTRSHPLTLLPSSSERAVEDRRTQLRRSWFDRHPAGFPSAAPTAIPKRAQARPVL
jgi:hypothetical protein